LPLPSPALVLALLAYCVVLVLVLVLEKPVLEPGVANCELGAVLVFADSVCCLLPASWVLEKKEK
jgi:hypothetical protein